MMTRARRGRGEGCIQQRKNGTWYAQISLGFSGSKRRRKTISGPTKAHVQNELVKHQAHGCTVGVGTAPTRVDKFLSYWLENAVNGFQSGATYDSYARNIRLHIVPAIGMLQIDKLTPIHIQDVVSGVKCMRKHDEGRAASNSSKLLVLAIMHRALKYAVQLGLIHRNVSAVVPRPRVEKLSVVPLNFEQTTEFLKKCQGRRLCALLELAVYTGARQGELIALRWSDVDLKAGTLSIQQTISTAFKKPIVKSPKTQKGRRKIPLPKVAVDALVKHKQRMMREGNLASGIVFCSQSGRMVKPSNVRQAFKEALAAAGLPSSTRFHDLRHGHASHLLSLNTHPKEVQERLGHANIGITLDIYSHMLPDSQKELTSKLNELYG